MMLPRPPSSNPAWTAFRAATPAASATRQLVRISLVAIRAMLMSASARARNMRPAVPAVAGIPAPTALTRAIAGPFLQGGSRPLRQQGGQGDISSVPVLLAQMKLMSATHHRAAARTGRSHQD